jgi:hypothetical protein
MSLITASPEGGKKSKSMSNTLQDKTPVGMYISLSIVNKKLLLVLHNQKVIAKCSPLPPRIENAPVVPE